MALSENVEAVIAAIEAVYSTCDERPKQGEIVAASGLSRSTYARVMREHPEARRVLDLAESVLTRRRASEARIDTVGDPDGDDPIKRNPLGAVDELLETITHLTGVIEAQKKHIRGLEEELTLRRLDF
jgi:hypothetical protein